MKVLVTGGGGFLGAAITRQLLGRGDQVRIFARGSYPALASLGAEVFQGDLRQKVEVEAAFEGIDAVIHTAAKAGVWGPRDEYEGINVLGTQHILDACRARGVRYLVFTSSPSVVMAGTDIDGADESLPYSPTYVGHYSPSKAEAERRVMAANGSQMATVSLRPHLIWGPGDPHILPRLEKQARAGKLKRIGAGDPIIDHVFVENAAEAHVLALDKLRAGAPIGGKVYFITNGEPIGVWTMVNSLLDAVGAPTVSSRVPRGVAYALAWVLETVHRLLKLDGEPRLTRFAVKELSCAHWFSIEAARRELGYQPRISLQEGLALLSASRKQG